MDECREAWRRAGKGEEYKELFKGCIHRWDSLNKGQCPECARYVMRSIDWSLVDKWMIESLKGIIEAAQKGR